MDGVRLLSGVPRGHTQMTTLPHCSAWNGSIRAPCDVADCTLRRRRMSSVYGWAAKCPKPALDERRGRIPASAIDSRVRSVQKSRRLWRKECCRSVGRGKAAKIARTVERASLDRSTIENCAGCGVQPPSRRMSFGATGMAVRGESSWSQWSSKVVYGR